MTAAQQDPARRIAMTAGGVFAAFYVFYASAPVAFAGLAPGPGVRIAAAMVLVVAVQPIILFAHRWTRHRRRTVLVSIALMSTGSAILPWGGHWAGETLLALGFGIFVVTSTAWAKEAVPPHQAGRALGLYGSGAAVGGALGAPIGLGVVDRFGIPGVAAVGVAFTAASLLPAARTVTQTAPVARPSALAYPHSLPSREDQVARGGAVAASLGIAGHLLAVTAYASALSGIADVPASGGSGSGLVVAAAFAVQVSVAAGRYAGGAASDHWSPRRAGIAAAALLTFGMACFVTSASAFVYVGSAVVIGLASGACQTAVLSALMRRADSAAATNRASLAWHIVFDAGLGLGALFGASALLR